MATTLRSCLCNSFFFGSLQTALSLFWPIDMDMDEVIREDMAQAVQIWRKQNGKKISSVQFNSVTQSCPILCDSMNRSTPGLPVCHQLPEFTQTHSHQVSDAIQPSHPLWSLSPPDPNSSQHQSLFQCVHSLHEVAKVLEFQLQHQSFQ